MRPNQSRTMPEFVVVFQDVVVAYMTAFHLDLVDLITQEQNEEPLIMMTPASEK